MITTVKVAKTKPQVRLTMAVGMIDMRADNIVDVSVLTALYRGMNGGDGKLSKAIIAAAKRVAAEWRNGVDFEMRPSRKAKETP